MKQRFGYSSAYKFIISQPTSAKNFQIRHLVLPPIIITYKYNHFLLDYNWSQMEGRNQTWQNNTSKNAQPAKTYGLNTSSTAVCHIYAHEVIISQTANKIQSKSYLTIATFDRDFVLLENRGFAQMMKDVQFKEILRVRTNYPIMHCLIEFTYEALQNKYLLIGYLIDIYSTLYTINLSRAQELALKTPVHPIQFNTLTQAFRHQKSLFKEELLYLETPLMLKKYGSNLISVNLKGQILVVDITQSKSWIRTDDLYYYKQNLGWLALAAAHNRIRCKYESVIIVATNNGRAPYVFVNCASTVDFENQKLSQDKYEWIEDSVQVTNCTIDPTSSLVCVSTVSQTIEIFEVTESKDSRGSFYFLKKKFAFFVSNNLHFHNINIENNIETIHAGKGMLMITTSKEHIVYDLIENSIRKRSKGTNISMLKWGQIIDRKDNYISFFIAKGYNHFNQEQSKIGKPNIHFKVIELK